MIETANALYMAARRANDPSEHRRNEQSYRARYPERRLWRIARDRAAKKGIRFTITESTAEMRMDADGHTELPATTIFITGPVLWRWGFHHSEQWVDAYEWDDYLASKGIRSMKMEGYAEQLKKGSK